VKIRIVAVIVAIAALVAVALYGGRIKDEFKHQLAFPSVRGFPRAYAGVVSYNLYEFDQGCNCTPNLAAQYLHIGMRISMSGPRYLLADGAVPLLELEPFNMSLTSISDGAEDKWLWAYAKAIAGLHAPVMMSFAPEANGTWYTWGYHPDVAASAFKDAWRHVVTLFRLAGATDVRWAWIMNVNFQGSENIASLWPGQQYVNILGLDGYFTTPAAFSTFFGPTIVAMRTLSSDPLLITETAAAPAVGKLQTLREIISGVSEYGLLGFVWFDVDQHGSTSRQDWRLEDSHAALELYSRHVARVVATP
jgi:mannan endo-1,4-beta-mannosidase